LRALAQASPRVKTMSIGRTEEGREILVAFVSSDENIRDLESNRQRLRRLADPRGLTPDEARQLIARTTKPHYHRLQGANSFTTTWKAEHPSVERVTVTTMPSSARKRQPLMTYC